MFGRASIAVFLLVGGLASAVRSDVVSFQRGVDDYDVVAGNTGRSWPRPGSPPDL